MGHCLHCPVNLAVPQSCSFRTQNVQTQCKFYRLPVLLLLFVFPHLPTWCVLPSVVRGIMVYCQAEPISCSLWLWQHRADTAKKNIAASVTKLVSCADSSALMPHGTAAGNWSLSSFLDPIECAVNVAESVESFTVLLKLRGTAMTFGYTFPPQRCCWLCYYLNETGSAFLLWAM